MNQEMVSVIVPVYNTEKYLSRCLDSIVNQTYRNLEILLIDDGSTDSSAEICRRYAKDDDRILLLQKTNGGQASARNLGLGQMRGQYVIFIDSDDFVREDFIEELYRQIQKEEGIDIAVSGYQKVWEDEAVDAGEVSRPSKTGPVDVKVYTAEEALELLLYQRVFNHSPWPKLFRRSIFEEIRFPEHCGYEDLAIIYRTFAAAEKISFGAQVGYYYLQREGSTMRKAFNKKQLDRLVISREILVFVETHYPQLVKAAEARLFLSALQQLMVLPREKTYQDLQRETFSVICQYRSGILRNRQVKGSLRGMALCSYLGLPALKWLGDLYNRLVNRA